VREKEFSDFEGKVPQRETYNYGTRGEPTLREWTKFLKYDTNINILYSNIEKKYP
jgi:hypothetical protein